MSTDIEYKAPSTSTQSEKAKAKRAERNRLFYLKKKAAEAMFELLMGNDVAPRKEFISTAEIDRDRIDA